MSYNHWSNLDNAPNVAPNSPCSSHSNTHDACYRLITHPHGVAIVASVAASARFLPQMNTNGLVITIAMHVHQVGVRRCISLSHKPAASAFLAIFFTSRIVGSPEQSLASTIKKPKRATETVMIAQIRGARPFRRNGQQPA